MDLRQTLAEYLRMCGIAVTEAACGLEFYKLPRKAAFDVAIIDVNLPDCTGFELAGELAPEAERMGIIMLTARTGRDNRIRGYGEAEPQSPCCSKPGATSVKSLRSPDIRYAARRTFSTNLLLGQAGSPTARLRSSRTYWKRILQNRLQNEEILKRLS